MSRAPTGGDPPTASVVLVLAAGPSQSDVTLDALVQTAHGASEVIVVANGRDALASFDATRWPGARLIALDDVVPFGAAANRGASAAVGRAVCFIAPGATVEPGWLSPLLSAIDRPSVACAVPQVIAPDGRLLEAGAVMDRDGAVAALGTASAVGPLEHLFSRRTDGGSRGCICVRSSSFVAVGGFDPSLNDPVVAGIDLSSTLRDSGLDTVYEPASRVMIHDAADHPPGPLLPASSPGARVLRDRWAASVPVGRPLLGTDTDPADRSLAFRDADCGDRILVVTDSVPLRDRTHGERRVAQLLTDLAALVPEARLTLLALEGHDARRSAPGFLGKGIEVVVGPEDWDGWFRRRLLLFSHVVVTDIPSFRRLDGVLRRTQPQACRVLALPSLDFRALASITDAGDDPDDVAGMQLLVGQLTAQVEQAAAGTDAAWCATSHDQAWFTAAAPGIRCAVVPTATAAMDDVPFERRSGYVVLATPGADLKAGHEDAALRVAREVFPVLLARDPSAFLRVVVDDPSPALQLLASRNIELVPAGHDPGRWFRRSRACLAWYTRGNGGRDALIMAIDARTPFVTSEIVLRDGGLRPSSGLVAADDAQSVWLRAEQLHGQQHVWEEAHDELVRLAQGPRSSSAARLSLLRACADVGIAPRPGAPLEEPIERIEADEASFVRPRNVAMVGSAWKAAPPAEDGPVPDLAVATPDGHWSEVPVNDQYQRWCARYGPTQRRLARLAERLTGLVRRPTISIVMPVFNTEPSWLHDAISSVRSQVYENWELCIGDDGSVAKGTINVIEEHMRDEARIRLVRLPGQQGIAAASNAALSLATGQFVCFLDHDDELKPHALGEIVLALDDQPELDLIYTDEDKREPDGRLVDPFFKPDWSPDHLMSRNYVCHLLTLRRSLLDKLGGFRLGYDGSQDYDLVLRATELTTRIAHIHEPLYTWRKVPGSTASVGDAKPWALDAARRVLKDALDRRGTPGEVVDGMLPTTYRVRYALRGRPLVSILIPTRDRVDLLRRCVDSIRELSTYTDYEIVVVDNQSTDPETLAYLAGFPGQVVRYPHRFHYARMVNLAAHNAAGDMLLFLNNDTQVISPDWLEALVEHGQRPEVGIVAPRLRYLSGRPQHEGTIVGHKGGHAGNVDHGGYWGLGDIVRNCSAVTGACLMIRPSVYWEVGGHEERLRIAWNDVDLCLRVRQAGYQVVYTPYAELYHVEGGTRGIHTHYDDDAVFEGRWVTHKCLDPYYNANLERLRPFCIRT